jgi:hypothetical protein
MAELAGQQNLPAEKKKLAKLLAAVTTCWKKWI